MAAAAIVSVIFAVILSCSYSYGDPILDAFAPAQVYYEKFVYIENELIQLTRMVLAQEPEVSSELLEVKRLADFVETRLNINNASIYTAHPVNVYHVTKRLADYWSNQIDALANSELGKTVLKTKFYNIKDNLPSQQNLSAIAYNLPHLQYIYDLDIDQLLAGKIRHQQADPLTSQDCYKIGEAAYEDGDYYLAEMWLQRASILSDKENSSKADDSDDSDVIMTKASFIANAHLLSSTYYKMNMLEEALMMLDIVLMHDPENRMAKINQKFYKDIQGRTPGDITTGSLEPPTPSTVKGRNYLNLCRGRKLARKPSIVAKLKCYHKKIGMFTYIKTEQLSLSPLMVLFHDVLGKTEFEFVNETAHELLYENALYGTTDGYSTLHADVFIMGHNAYNKKINKIIRQITDVRMTREAMKVSNFGVGGRKIPFMRFDKEVQEGQNSSTVLFFLNDDFSGGATVFPYLRLRVDAKPNTMLYWPSTTPGGEVDPITIRAECPVLHGSKWVATKFLHSPIEKEKKQEEEHDMLHDEL